MSLTLWRSRVETEPAVEIRSMGRRSWHWAFQIDGSTRRYPFVSIGFFQQYSYERDPEWSPSHSHYYVAFMPTCWKLGAFHDYYDGPNCCWALGPFRYCWSGDWCDKCMPAENDEATCG